MKVLSISIFSIILSSYVYGFFIAEAPKKNSEPTYQVKEDINITVARSYSPDSHEKFDYILNYGSFFDIPESIDVTSGSSGDGWFSLILGERKFCYQGNRYNSKDTFGDKFVLKGELINISDKCYSKVFENFNDSTVYSEYGDVIVAKIEGGGCDYCEYTEVEFDLVAVNEE